MGLFLAVSVVLLAGFAGSLLGRAVGLPMVIGQMITGILLGPLFFGALWPEVSQHLFTGLNREVIRTIGVVAVGVLLFIGGATHRRGHDRARDAGLLTVSNIGWSAVAAALVMPVMSGMGTTDVTPSRCAFLVIAFAVCALPVMARVIEENGLSGTRAARHAFSVGMSTDLIAWVAVGLLGVSSGAQTGGRAILSLGILGAAVILWMPATRAVRFLLERAPSTPVTLVVACGCAAIGVATALAVTLDPALGALAGGMLFGRAAQRLDTASRDVSRQLARLGRVNAAFLLPVFFASMGLSCDLRGATAVQLLVLSVLVTFCAIAARVLGTLGVARWTELAPAETRTVCALLCSRGATELAMLSIGAQMGLLSEAQFAPLVIMAIVTTVLSGVLTRPRREDRQSGRPVTILQSPASIRT